MLHLVAQACHGLVAARAAIAWSNCGETLSVSAASACAHLPRSEDYRRSSLDFAMMQSYSSMPPSCVRLTMNRFKREKPRDS